MVAHSGLRLGRAWAWLPALVFLVGCGRPAERLPTSVAAPLTATSTQVPSATATPPPTSTSTNTPYPPPVGPGHRTGFNPLTGLRVADEATLRQRPILVAITNFPPSARPQAGLSAASQVWETSIGQGMTRFLAVYYGDYFEQLRALEAAESTLVRDGFVVGPVRSGRVAFEDIKRLFPHANLLTHSASAQVLEQLTNRIQVASDDPQDVNSAGLTLEELQEITAPGGDPQEYASLTFDFRTPPGGSPGLSLDVFYNTYNRVRWEFAAPQGVYRRWQNTVEMPDVLVPASERLDGEPLGFENVVVLFTGHRFVNPEGTILEIDLLFHPHRFGLLFRDGRWYEISWSTLGAQLEIRSPEGEVLALHPGRTFFELVGLESTWDAESRRVRFYSPVPPTATPRPTATPTVTPSPTP
jgi:hypothetical protein